MVCFIFDYCLCHWFDFYRILTRFQDILGQKKKKKRVIYSALWLTCYSTWPRHTSQMTYNQFLSLGGLNYYLDSLGSKGLLQYTLGPTLAWAIRTLIEYAILAHSAPGWTRTQTISIASWNDSWSETLPTELRRTTLASTILANFRFLCFLDFCSFIVTFKKEGNWQ